MPLEVDKNTKYGPPLVTDKYRPLGAITFTSQPKEYFGTLMTNRLKMLKSLGLLPQKLTLAVRDWNDTIASEAGKKPPLVVISNNRSIWIGAAFESAKNRLLYLGPEHFDNISDLRALSIPEGMEKTPPKMSPPIYCPLRIGDAGPRNIYIVVHISEYNFYRALAPYGVTIVGWGFRRPRQRAEWLTGFGPSRFAAIEFCKKLRKLATVGGTAPWDYAWLLDDNVVTLTGFPGFDAIEKSMTAEHVCAGFEGGTATIPFDKNKGWAADEIDEGRGGQSEEMPPDKKKGLVQQAALWNIDYLTRKDLNFGLTYFESAEDLSFGFYLDTDKTTKYRYYGRVSIRKEDVTVYDNSPGVLKLQKERKRLTRLFADRESTKVMKGTAPPPIWIKPKEILEDGAHEMTLGNFVVSRVLPKAVKVKRELLESEDVETAEGLKNTAKCQAVEQITCLAIKGGFMPKTDADEIFKLTKAQKIEQSSTRTGRKV
jgi:hypothetical protein